MHYFIKNAFEPVALIARETNGALKLQVISDLRDSISASLELKVLDFKGNILSTRSFQVQMPDNTAFIVASIPASALKGEGNGRERVLEMTLRKDDGILARALHYFQPVKHLNLPKDPGIAKTITALPNGEGYLIEISAQRLAKNILLEFPSADGHFSDNYFDLLPGETRKIHFLPRSGGALTAADLQVLTVVDTF